MSGLISIKLGRLIEDFQTKTWQARQDYLETLEAFCEKVHDEVEKKINTPGITDAEIASVGEVEEVALLVYQIMLNIHDPIATYDEPETKDAS